MRKGKYYLAELIRGAIIENTLAGFDKDGKKFKAYSTKPFAMPWGAVVSKKKLKGLEKEGKVKGKNQENRNVLTFINKETGAKWVVIKGGYAKYKSVMLGHSEVNLSMTGAMLKGLMVQKEELGGKINIGGFEVNIPSTVSVRLGWKDINLAKRAVWNKERGRDMLGLSEAKVQEVLERKKKEEGIFL